MTDSREIRNLANGVGDDIGKGYDDSTEPVPKKQRKSRNESEKRRREKLNVYISELANMVPQCSAAQRKLDKTTILKLTVNYIKVYNDLTVSVLGNRTGVQSMVFSSEELGELMDQVLDGLLLVMTRSGKLVYISESVNSLLGFTKEFVMGKSIYEFLHPDDRHQVVKELTRDDTVVFHSTSAGSSPKVSKPPSRRSFKIRLKVNENEKERNEFYEGFHCVGYLDNWTNGKVRPADVQGTFKDVQQQVKLNREAEFPPEEKCFVGVALSARSNLKRPLSSNIDKTGKEYLSRHTLDGKLLYVDTRSISITGYLPYEVLGTSIYKYIHHNDMKVVAKYHKTLMEYGECTSDCYRLLTKGDQWIWLQSRIYISYNHWNSKPELYVSTNQVISEEEGLKALNERIIQEGSFCASTMQALKAIDVCSENQEINEAALSSSSKNELCCSDGAESGISNNEKKAEDSSFVSASMELPSSEVSTLQIPEAKVSPVHNVSENDVTVAEEEESNKIVGVLTSKDLESFVEAQRQLQEQLARKHSSLEEAIGKQKEQLRIIQQHMFLNIQAQLTVDPNKNQEIISREFERTRILTEEHEKQEKRQKELSLKLAEQQKQAEERYQVQLNLLLRNKPYLLEEKARHQLNELPLSQMQQKQFLPVEENVVSSHNTTTLPLASNNLPAIADNEHGVRLTSLSRQNVPYSSSIATHRDTQQFLSSPDVGAQTFDSRQRPLIFQQLQSQSQVHGNPLQGQNHQNAVTSLWQQRKLQEQLDQISSSAIPQSSSLELESSLAQYTAFSNKPLGSTAGVDFSASASQSQALVPQEHLKNAAGLTLQQKQYTDSQALQNLQELLSSRENVHQLVSSLSSRPDLTKSLLGILQLAQNNASPAVADQSGTSLSNASIGLGATQLQASVLQNKSSLPSLFHHPLQKQPPIQQQKLQQIQLQQQQQQQLQQQQQQRQQQQKQQQQQQQQQQRQQQQQQQQHQQQRQHQQQDLFQFGKRGQSSPAVSFPTASSNVTLPGSLSSRTSSAASQVQQISKPLTDSSEFTRTSSSKEKSKVKRDYFSNFTSSELQAMLLRSLPRMTTNEVDSTECTTPEEKKLKDEPQRYNPLLTEYRELLDMQQEQGKQLIINQQKQIWEQLQRNESELEQRSTDSPELQQTRDKTQSSYFNVPLEQTTKDECFRYASSGPSGSGLSTWDQGLEPINLGISDEDDQVLNLLLAESSLDPLFTDPMSWGDDNGFVANLNPD